MTEAVFEAFDSGAEARGRFGCREKRGDTRPGGVRGKSRGKTATLGATPPLSQTPSVGDSGQFARPVSSGGVYNKGEGIEMMLAAGVAPAGQYDMFHGAPIDPRSLRAEAIVGTLNFGILVNTAGRRFIDEGTHTYEHFYDEA